MASDNNGDGPASKKSKDEFPLPPLEEFILEEVLGNDSDRKSAFLHLAEKREGAMMVDKDGNRTRWRNRAVVIMDKKPFSDEDFQALLNSNETKLRQLFTNDIYGGYEIELPAKNSAVKATIIYPATEKHIEKYRRIESVMVSETAEDYEKIVLPHITQSQFSTQWVDNVLDGKAEADRIIYRDQEFILAPDLKWDGSKLENLYVTAIVCRKGIKSIRDLDADHLPLLKNIWKKGSEAISSKYKIDKDRLRVFVHYQPSYYHLHVHFVHLMCETGGTIVGKAHLLADIIDNIQLKSDYYRVKTLHYALKTNDPLLEKMRSKGGKKSE